MHFCLHSNSLGVKFPLYARQTHWNQGVYTFTVPCRKPFKNHILTSAKLDFKTLKTRRSIGFIVLNQKWRPYRESNPGYLREREVS
jgi:hypothetical protein